MTENFHLFLNVIVYFLNFSGIICMMFIVTANFNYLNMIQHIFSNWSLGFINDIKIYNKTKSENEVICPVDYEFLFEFHFPGTKSGCNCLGITNMTGYTDFEDKLIPGTCSLMLNKFGCQSVADLPSKSINSLEDKYYCIRRAKFDYLSNYTGSIYELECPVNMKSCGIVDSIGNLLCVGEENNNICPLSDLSNLPTNLSNTSDLSNLSNLFPISNITIKSNTSRDNFTNSIIINQLPLSWPSPLPLPFSLPGLIRYFSFYFVQFKLSQGNVCINNDEINLYSEYIYELFNSRRTMKCNTQLSDLNLTKFKYDFRYTPLIATTTESVFYKEDFIKTNALALPKFPNDFFDNPITIHARNYIGWNKKCKEYIVQFKDMQRLANKIENYSIFYLVYSLFMLIYCMLFIMIFKELIYQQYSLKILIILIHVLMIIIIFFIVLNDYLEINQAIKLCFIIINKRCSDEVTNRLTIFVLRIFKEISDLFLIVLILYIIMILLSIVKILLTFYKLYKRSLLTRLIQGDMNEIEMILLM